MELTEEQQEFFLERVAQGDNRKQAAEWVADQFEDDEITATRFKFLCSRSPEFNRRYEAALLEGRGELTDRLKSCAVELALGGHWPALKFLMTAYDKEFEWARTSRVEVAGTVEISAVASTLAKYLPPEKLDELMQVVEQGMASEDQKALPPAV